MILVTGATGHFGKATIEFLLAKGVSPDQISAFVRDEAKAQDLKAKGLNIKIGDYDDYASMIAAFKGADKLLLVSGTDMVNRTKQQLSAIKAAQEAGVKHIFYTSFERKNESETSPIAFLAKQHLDTEKAIKESGLNYTIFRDTLYLDVLPTFFGEKVLETGIIFPAGDGKAGFALRKDMAEAAANVLIGEGHENKEYIFSNTENVSIKEVADKLSEVTGKNITYTNPASEDFKAALTKTGIPQMYADIIAGFAEAIKQGDMEVAKTDLERLLGRKPTTVKEFLSQVYAS